MIHYEAVKPESGALLDAVTRNYLGSRDVNGTPMRVIDADDETKRALAEGLVRRGLVTLNFGDRHPNPYVQALPAEDAGTQLSKLSAATDFTHICMYPTAAHLASVVDRSEYRDRPYTSRLALGEHLFTFIPFDLRALEPYRNDPRYWYETDDIQGFISVKGQFSESRQMREGDQVHLKQFGFGYDDDMERCVMVMLCDLADLSPEHQQQWKLREAQGSFKAHPNYVDSVMGRWPERMSLFTAFTEELKTINGMSALMGRPALFRQDFTDRSRPRKFGFLLRPTLGELNEFTLLLDKMISDNIDIKFFTDEVSPEFAENRSDGNQVVRPKGSLRMLEEWLALKVKSLDSAPVDEMIATFKRIRKLRQAPAHAIDEDAFDQNYGKEQRQLMIDAYKAVRMLRLILANHPEARAYEVPDWLYEGKIWTY